MSRIRAPRKRTKALETRDRQHGQPCRIQNTGFASVFRLSEPVLRILWIEYRVVEMFRRHVRERKLLEEFDIVVPRFAGAEKRLPQVEAEPLLLCIEVGAPGRCFPRERHHACAMIIQHLDLRRLLDARRAILLQLSQKQIRDTIDAQFTHGMVRLRPDSSAVDGYPQRNEVDDPTE